MARARLGKGLDALILEAEDAADGKKNVKSVKVAEGHPGEDLFLDVSLLKPNPHQPRTEFDTEALQELANSIKEHGLIQPILVEEAGDGTFYIIAGERRTRAARLAGLEKIPVRIQKFSDTKKLEVALIENIQRENLNPLEEARAYHKLMDLANLNQDEAARRVGKKRSTVANALRLLKLPEDMQSALLSGELTAGHARAVLSVMNSADQRILFARIVGSALSVREAEQQAGLMNGGIRSAAKIKQKTAHRKGEPDYVFMENQLIEKLGTKVRLKGNFDKGSITIEYFSRDDLDRLYSILVK